MTRSFAVVALLFLTAAVASATVIDAVAAAAENTGTGWVLSQSSGQFNVGVSDFTSVERRGLLEYDLAGIPNSADVTSASISIYFYFLNDPPLPNVQLNGYVGDGVLVPSDAEVAFNEIARTGTFSAPQTIDISLNTTYIESLLATGQDWLGVMVYQLVPSGSCGYVAGTGLPRLTIEYIPEPAALLIIALAGGLLRRR